MLLKHWPCVITAKAVAQMLQLTATTPISSLVSSEGVTSLSKELEYYKVRL